MGQTSTSFLADGERTEGAFALVDERAKLGDSVPLHRHDEDMESFYVLEGEVMLFIGDEPGARAGAGSFAHVPGGTVHGFRIESETARYLILTTPRHGDFYRAITLPARADGSPPSKRSKDRRSRRPRRDSGSSSSGRCRTRRDWRNVARRSGRGARSEARTQGAPIAEAIGATEDAASGRAARSMRLSRCFADPS